MNMQSSLPHISS